MFKRWLGPVTLTDDRGAHFEPAWPVDLKSTLTSREREAVAAWRRRHRWWQLARIRLIVALLAATLCLATCAGGKLFSDAMFKGSDMAAWMAFAGMCLIYFLVIICSARAAAPTMLGRHSRILLSHHRCGACGYSLRGSLPKQDGCTVCSECGTAWRLTAGPKIRGQSSICMPDE